MRKLDPPMTPLGMAVCMIRLWWEELCLAALQVKNPQDDELPNLVRKIAQLRGQLDRSVVL